MNSVTPIFVTYFDTSNNRHQIKRTLGRLDNPYIVFRIPLIEVKLETLVWLQVVKWFETYLKTRQYLKLAKCTTTYS